MADLFDRIDPRPAIERRALEIWRDQELGYPSFVRRMSPDTLDRATGAWDRVLAEAAAEEYG